MKLLRRINKSEKLLQVDSKEKHDLDPFVSWLIKTNDEYKECLKQLWRVSVNVETSYEWQHREEAKILMNRMHEIAEVQKEKFKLENP